MEVTPELQEAYNKCVLELFKKKRLCTDKCKICQEERIKAGDK